MKFLILPKLKKKYGLKPRSVSDSCKKVSEGDLIVYENGQQVKERLLKETPKP